MDLERGFKICCVKRLDIQLHVLAADHLTPDRKPVFVRHVLRRKSEFGIRLHCQPCKSPRNSIPQVVRPRPAPSSRHRDDCVRRLIGCAICLNSRTHMAGSPGQCRRVARLQHIHSIIRTAGHALIRARNAENVFRLPYTCNRREVGMSQGPSMHRIQHRSALVAICSVVVLWTGACATELPARETAYKAQPASMEQSWTGFYVGLGMSLTRDETEATVNGQHDARSGNPTRYLRRRRRRWEDA